MRTGLVKADYSDAQFPYWRIGLTPGGNRTFVVEGTWGAQIVDDLAPQQGEHLVVKKGFAGFSNTPLDTILRNMGVTTCVVSGVTQAFAFRLLCAVASSIIIASSLYGMR